MKVIFDTKDLTKKIAALLELEGLEVEGDIVWGGSAGEPIAEVQIKIIPQGPPPKDTAYDITTSALEALNKKLSDMGEGMRNISADLSELDAEVVELRKDLTRGAKAPPPTTKETTKDLKAKTAAKLETQSTKDGMVTLTPEEKLAMVNKQIEEEEDFVASPFGGPAKNKGRRRAPNEYDDMPGD